MIYKGRYDFEWNLIEDFCKNNDKWKKVNSVQSHSVTNRPDIEKSQTKFYNEFNCSRYVLNIDKRLLDKIFTTSWFDMIGADVSKHYTAKITCTQPGHFEPPHCDYYPSFIGFGPSKGVLWSKEELEEKGKKIIRCWIPLEDSKLGHILYGNNIAIFKWTKGDIYELPSGVTHGFCNGGREDRYLLTFTAWKK